MDAYVQAGFGGFIGRQTLDDLRRLGYTGVRLEPSLPGLVEEVLDAGLRPFALVKDLDWFANVPIRTAVEFAPCEPPEPDLAMTVEDYVRQVRQALVVAEVQMCPLWIGAISNLNERGLQFLGEVIPRLRSERRGFSVSTHWYPHGDDPYTPHQGFGSRVQEVQAFRRIIGPRRWGVTEFGYHTATRPSRPWTWGWFFGRRRRWSDLDVARYVAWEWDFWERSGASLATIYQLNDGRDDTALGRYGIRDFGGTWKPVAASLRVARGWSEERDGEV